MIVLSEPTIYLMVGVIVYLFSFLLIYKKGRKNNNKALILLSFYFLVLCISPSYVVYSNLFNRTNLIFYQTLFIAIGNMAISVSDLFQNFTVDFLTIRRITPITSVLLFLFGLALGIILSGSVPLKLYNRPDIIVWGYDFQTDMGLTLFLFLFTIKLIGNIRFLIYSKRIEKKQEQTAKERIKGGMLFSRWFIFVFILYLVIFYFRIRELATYGLDFLITGIAYLLLFQAFLKKSNLYDRPPMILNNVVLSYKSGPILKLRISKSKISITEDPEEMVADRLVLLASDVFKNYDQAFSIFGIEKQTGYIMQYLIGNWSVVFFLSRYDAFYEEKIKEFGASIVKFMEQGLTANKGFMVTQELIQKIMFQMALIV